jgi:hypothetical protein
MIVACVRVAGNVPYAPEYVYKLRNMVQRHIGIDDVRFVCLTDRPEELPGIETIEIAPPIGYFGWWSKLQLFNPKHFPPGAAVLYLDLDVIVMRDLFYVCGYGVGSTLTLAADEGHFEGAHGKRTVKRYNSSVMTFIAGEHADLYKDWNASVALELWGDQDWIGERLPNQLTFPREWFPRISSIGADKQKAAGAHVVLCKRPKNHLAAQMWPWVAEVWR